MVGQRFIRLLEAVSEDVGQPIGGIDILGEEERAQILEEWNDTGHPVPESTLPELFEAQVEKLREATAVVFEEESLSYGELNRRANQLAHFLIARGIGAESIVGLALPRSFEMIVGLLGILKAGAAYLPLDLEYPKERIRFMLEDAEPACVVTQSSLAGQLPENTSLLLLDSAETRDELGGTGERNPVEWQRVQPLRPWHPAYVIYTSGPRGCPKGVVITHQNVVRSVWVPRIIGFTSGR